MEKIDSFNGEYYFLSNYYHSPIVFEGIHYPTVEHAFQAAKTLNNNKRLEIARMRTPGEAKKAGRTVSLRPDWEKIKFDLMFEVKNPLLYFFKQNLSNPLIIIEKYSIIALFEKIISQEAENGTEEAHRAQKDSG